MVVQWRLRNRTVSIALHFCNLNEIMPQYVETKGKEHESDLSYFQTVALIICMRSRS